MKRARAYDQGWLKNPQAFALDPDLSLGEGTYFPKPEAGNFRVFDDSAPDRWGQTLMKRREALAAKAHYAIAAAARRPFSGTMP